MAEQHISRRRVVDAAEQAAESLRASLENLEAARKAAKAMEKAYASLNDRMDSQARRLVELNKEIDGIIDANSKRDERFKDHDWFIYQLKKLSPWQWVKLIFRAEFPAGG